MTPGGRFCIRCGAKQEASPASPDDASPAAPDNDAPARPAEEIQAAEAKPLDSSEPGPSAGSTYRDKVTLALRELLQSDQPARIVSAATGLTQDLAARLRSTLVGPTAAPPAEPVPPAPEAQEEAAAAPGPEAAPPPPPPPPKPEPTRSMSAAARIVRERASRRGARTLTGLVLGRGGSYLAYGRAEGAKLLAPPDFIRLDARATIPTAVRLAGQHTTELCGNRALQSWVQDPAAVRLGFADELGANGDAAVAATRAFLKLLNYRMLEVLGPGAGNAGEGAATLLAAPVEHGDPGATLLLQLVEQAGFPVVQLVPEPLAAVAPYLSRDAGASPAQARHFLVIDWGSQGLDISVVEDAPDAAGPVVIDHVEHPLGGVWFDMIVEGWLAERLPGELSDEDRRALSLFARSFKEKASVSFSEGREEHAQYSVIPAGLPPTRVCVTRAELDDLFHDSCDHFQKIVAEAPARVGFLPEHFDQVVMVGGAARCHFARDAARTALGRAPMVAPNPEESIAKGLVFWCDRYSHYEQDLCKVNQGGD